MRGLRAVSLALLMAGACATPLWAQSAPPSNPTPPGQGGAASSQTPAQTPAQTAPQSAQPTPPARARPRAAPPADESDPDSEEEDATTVKELVVKGHRTPVGSVVGDIKPEISLSPADIQSYGVSTLTELLTELGPEVRSDRGRDQSPPVILLNGRRISSFNEIQNIPTEAILRVDILPEEVSLKYGYTADQRVVNVVLRRRFRAWTGELKGGGPTEGGQVVGQAEGDLLHLHNDDRLNVDLKYVGNSDLTEAERGIETASTGAGSDFSVPGNIVAASQGGQLASLSALAGKPVTIAGVPASAALGAPSLSAFLPTAGVANTTNLGDDRTLAPDSQTLTLNGVLAHSTLGGVALTLNGTLSVNQSDALQGLPGAALSLPAANPFNPFGQTVMVDRYVPGLRPLTQVSNGWTGHLGLTANKDAYGWRFSLTGAYDHSDSLTVTETGLAPNSLAQQQLNALAPTFNPYGPLPANLFTLAADNKGRAISEQGNTQILANGPLAELPAGDLYASLKLGDTIQGFWSRTDRDGVATNGFLWRNDLNAQSQSGPARAEVRVRKGLGRARRPVAERQRRGRPALGFRDPAHARIRDQLDPLAAGEPDRVAHARPPGAHGAAARKPAGRHPERAGLRLSDRPDGAGHHPQRRQCEPEGRLPRRDQGRGDGEAVGGEAVHLHGQLHLERHQERHLLGPGLGHAPDRGGLPPGLCPQCAGSAGRGERDHAEPR